MFAQLRWCVTTLCLLLTAAAPMAEAQGASQPATGPGRGVASSFEQLRVLVRPGDTVSVTDTTGREITGTIADLSSSSVALLVAGSRRDLPESEVRTIRQRRPDSLANGALWGLAIGASIGLSIALIPIEDGESYGAAALPGAAMLAGVGAGIGVGVDAMIAGRHVIYAKPAGSSSRVRVSPLLTRERKGVFVSLGF
jgi:hypothetical protein